MLRPGFERSRFPPGPIPVKIDGLARPPIETVQPDFGQIKQSAQKYAGGWGPILGDEGSGYWIGVQAIRDALQARDQQDRSPLWTSEPLRRVEPLASGIAVPPLVSNSTSATSDVLEIADSVPSSQLLDAILRAWGLNSLSELIELGNHRGDAIRPAPDFASLTPVVADCARQGNCIAAHILLRAGIQLGHLIHVLARSMFSSPASAAVEIAFAGSVLTHIEPVRLAMTRHLAGVLPAAHIQAGPVDPLEGALYRARQV